MLIVSNVEVVSFRRAAPAAPEVSVYPNPTTGVVTIRRLPSPYPLPGGEGMTLDFSGLPAGTYFVRVQGASDPVMRAVVKE